MKRGKKYRAFAGTFDTTKSYSLAEAVRILKGWNSKFDNTVEVHMGLGVDPKQSDQNVRGTVVLPHGTGKKVRIVVLAKGDNLKAALTAGADFAGAEDIVAKIQEGWLDFDQVVATPDMMPVVGKVAKILGPRGLMPNPKAGTVTTDVAKVVRELKAGKVQYRLDKAANVHVSVGKLSFEPEQVQANARVLIEAVYRARPSSAKGDFVKSIHVAATMSPGIKVNRAEFR